MTRYKEVMRPPRLALRLLGAYVVLFALSAALPLDQSGWAWLERAGTMASSEHTSARAERFSLIFIPASPATMVTGQL